MSLEIDIDLTQHSTFPQLTDPQIPRDSLIRWLSDRFSPERKVIIVQGPDGAGKTTLLAQFAKAFSSRCFSYFIKKDYWTLTPQSFLTELCTQMQKIVANENTEIGESYYEIEKTFSKFYHRVATKARQLNQPFYFVVDGLEWIPKSYGEKSIIDLLPHDPLDGIYLLASSAPVQQFPFEHHPEPIMFFTPTETEAYLHDVGLDKEKAKNIHKACDGMPGYLDQIRREIQLNISLDEILTNLPNDCALDGLAVLAYSELALEKDTLAEIVSTSCEMLEKCLISISFIQTNQSEQTIHFVTDAHRRFIADKLTDRRTKVDELLISYYQKDRFSKLSLIQLPILLKESKRYELLKSLISVEYLNRTLEQTQDMFLLRRNARILADDAFNIMMADNSDAWPDALNERQTLSKYALISSILRTLSTETTADAEIDALLALNDYEKSQVIAHQAVLPEDRLQLLAKIGSRMKQQERLIPPELLLDLEQLVLQINPKGSLRERIIEVAADLFYVHHQATMDLIEKVAGNDRSGRLMDRILAFLALKIEGKAIDSVETLRSRISDENLQEFARAYSPIVANFTPEQVLVEATKIRDTSGKLYLLRAWCNANRKNPEAIKVIDVALEIMTTSTDYAISMRHLRQFAEPLSASESDEVYKIIERIDLLKETAVKKPIEEAVRLELLLASIEASKFQDQAITRLYTVYLGLIDVAELDIRCYGLTRILLSLPTIKPNDAILVTEVEQRLITDYQVLLNESADHLALTRRLLRALTNYKPEMALEFSKKLNMRQRRERGFREILQVYTDRESTSLDLSFIENVLEMITDKQEHDQTFVSILKQFAKKDVFSHNPQVYRFIEKISELLSPVDQSFANAYCLQMVARTGKDKEAENLLAKMENAWSKIDQKWHKIEIGFELATIVAEASPQIAQQFVEKVRHERDTATPLAQSIFAEVYVNTLRLAIRAFPDTIKSQKYAHYKGKLLDAINHVPSYSLKCQLVAELALRHYLNGKEQEFREFAAMSLKNLELCEDEEACAETIVEIAPCLFQYERSLLNDEISRLSIKQHDDALAHIILYLLSGRPSGDPVDVDSLVTQVKYESALSICELLEQMNSDSSIYSYLSQLVDNLVRRDINRNREKSHLPEKQVSTIAKKFRKIAEEKLPDPHNIKHDGYLVAVQSSIARLRASSENRASIMWAQIALPWSDITQAVRQIPNTADRAFVMALIGTDMYKSEPGLGKDLLEETRECILKIPNLVDRIDRFQKLAESWHEVDDNESAKFFVKEAMVLLEESDWNQTSDKLVGQILQLAHSIAPEFASSLTSTVDNPIVKHNIEQDLASRDLQHQPNKLLEQNPDKENSQEILGQAAWRLLRSYCSGRGQPQLEKLVGQWTHAIVDAQFEETYNVLAWSIENDLVRTKQRLSPALTDTIDGLLDALHMILLVGETMLGIQQKSQNLQRETLIAPLDLHLFPAGSRNEAINALREWLRENAETYLKIHDPYFTAAELDILKSVAPDIRVLILTSWKVQKVSPGDVSVIEQRFKDAWKDISDLQPPETRIYILGDIEEGDSPMHQRYYITAKNRGIELGTSQSGLGLKDSHIRILDSDEVSVIERDFFDRLIFFTPPHFKGKKLRLDNISLV
ncbi:MAG: ATP-binding protein [Chloroflexi bacterium]|nr:ATP-binding protein [Chloroflexota bacterium]